MDSDEHSDGNTGYPDSGLFKVNDEYWEFALRMRPFELRTYVYFHQNFGYKLYYVINCTYVS